MAENIEQQKMFIKNQFKDFEILKSDNATEKGIAESQRFPTDALISNGKSNIGLQFTELQCTKIYHDYRIKKERYGTGCINNFIKEFSSDRYNFAWSDSISLFDENLLINFAEPIVAGKIKITDVEFNDSTEEEFNEQFTLEKEINNSKQVSEVLGVFKYLLKKYDILKFIIENKHSVKLELRVKEKHFPIAENMYNLDFFPAYMADIETGLDIVLTKKNKFKTSEQKKLRENGITRENHYLVCQVAEYVNLCELQKLKGVEVKSEKYSKIYITYNNVECVVINTVL